jgi:lysyl-tRNA synthetase, class II
MFRSALARGEKIGAGPVLRAWRGLLVFLSRWFQIQSLYKFNAKFQPRWEPRYVVYAAARDLPRIGTAAMQAEGFMNLSLSRFLHEGFIRSRTGCATATRVSLPPGSADPHQASVFRVVDRDTVIGQQDG